MQLRIALYELAAEQQLQTPAGRRLQQLAGPDIEPAALQRGLVRGVAVLAGVLGGLGLIFWVAANWDGLGRTGRFGLLQALLLVMALGAAWREAARVPLGLVSLLAMGGLLAYFGQTYQTGADPWQLFAWWAALALPLCLGVRSDVLWVPWAVVAVSAVSLWVHAHTGHRWRVDPADLVVHLFGWCLIFAVVLATSPLLRRFTGAGVWALRTALTLAVVAVAAAALGGLLQQHTSWHYGLGLAVLAAAALLLLWPAAFEIYGLSAVALGLNTLLIAGLARWLFDRRTGHDFMGPLLLIGLAAAGVLAASVTGILWLVRRQAVREASR